MQQALGDKARAIVSQLFYPNISRKTMTITTRPNDPLYRIQWHLQNIGQTGGTRGMDLNVLPVWRDYTGQGVRVAVLDEGVDYLHPDLANNYDANADIDAAERDGDPAPYWDEPHGTAVAGLISAEGNNNQGGLGVAPGSTISGIRVDYYDDAFQVNAAYALGQMANFDVVNNSWSYASPFSDTFDSKAGTPLYAAALELAIATGRDGLGTIVVFSAGNSRQNGDSANYHNLQNSRFTLAVAALTHEGKHTSYSSPGANVLVSAFGGDSLADWIVTTDLQGYDGYDSGDYTDDFGGTSAAAPMVAGVVALMLEANPNLGYRDVQEILAYSARQTDRSNTSWLTNGATTWNGGGLQVSNDYGFGLVDARAAVRLAETWHSQHTLANEQVATGEQAPGTAILDNAATIGAITLDANLAVDQVEVFVNLTHNWIGDLELVLTSPSGTESLLMARPGMNDYNIYGLGQANLRFTFSSVQFWGESSLGTWTLTVRDQSALDEGILVNWNLKAFGDAASADDTYIYTNAFSLVANAPERLVLTDTSGMDVLNAAAVTSDLWLDLRSGATSQIAGQTLTIAANTVIESAIGGDGRDHIRGNAANNTLSGGRFNDRLFGFAGIDALKGDRGNDALFGGIGNDTLMGGIGNDTLNGGSQTDILTGGRGADRFTFGVSSTFSEDLGVDQITDFGVGSDLIVLSKRTFSAIASQIGRSFNLVSEFARVANDLAVAESVALIVYSQATGNLFYNANGTEAGYGSGGQFAALSTPFRLNAQHFVLQA